MLECENQEFVSVADGTIDREAQPKRWYVVKVQVKCEKRCADRLGSLGYEVFLPTQTVIRQWSDRKKKMEKVVISTMFFVHCDEKEIRKVERYSFINCLMRAPGENRPAVIPDNQIETFRFMIGQSELEVIIDPPTFIEGNKVRVVRGPLQGLVGDVTDIGDGKSKLSVNMENMLNASVTIDKADLEIIK